MKTRSLTLAGAALSLFCAAGLAYIHPNAPATAQSLEDNAAATHSYIHTAFPSSYGSHEMEDAAEELNETLFGWQFGLATECDVEPLLAAAQDAFDSMTTQFLVNGVFMDPQAVTHYYDVYFDLGVLDFYLSMLWCLPPPHAGGPGAGVVTKRVSRPRQATGVSLLP